MKFFTKEWYNLMQQQHYTSGLKKIPDKIYSDEEIKAFYDADLAKEIAHDRRLHNTPPDFSWAEELLDEENFQPNNFLIVNEETGEAFHPETFELAKAYIENDYKRRKEQFANRPPFDLTETIECFEECYRNMLRYGTLGYPEWVGESVDKRLLALQRMPETAYKRLKKEEAANKRAFNKIMKEAEKVLSSQDIPEEISSQFYFHDANVLSLKRTGANVELLLRKDGGWPEGTPYIKILFKNVSKLEREKGFAIRPRTDEEGELCSNVQYLYEELYRTSEGYEVHMLLWTVRELRYLTISCEEIEFIDNIEV